MTPNIRWTAIAIAVLTVVSACGDSAPASPSSAPSVSAATTAATPSSSPSTAPTQPAGSPSATARPSSPPPTAGGSNPPPCTEATLAYDPERELMLLLNCVDQFDQASVEQVWAWHGAAWELLADDGPPATVVTGVAFDPARGTAVRYGGLPMDSNDCVPETWEWDGSSWTSPDVAPPTVCDHMFLTHDRRRDQTLLYGGGTDDGDLLTETWSWNGRRWRRLADEGPAGRAHFGFVYDAEGRRPVLYGGYDGSAVFDDLWTWDGAAWSEEDAGDGPGPRSHHGLAAGGGDLLLFGGASTPSTFASLQDDTWRLSGGEWEQLEGTGPSTRGSPAMGYDEGRDTFVLYGGFDASGNLLGDTWEWSDGWRCITGC